MNKTITIDLDNVLCETTQSFLEWYAELYGETHDISEVKKGFMQDNPNLFTHIPRSERAKSYNDFTATSLAHPPTPGAQETIQQLHDQGYTMIVITGRENQRRTISQARLIKYFPGMFEDLILTNARQANEVTKGEMCKKVGARVHIDDFIEFSSTIIQVGIPVMLYDRPWTEYIDITEQPLITRVHSRGDIQTLLPSYF